MAKQTTAEKLANMENDVFRAYGMDRRPAGKLWLQMVLDLAKRITEEIPPEDLTPEVLDELTADNFHTVRHAAELVLELWRFQI